MGSAIESSKHVFAIYVDGLVVLATSSTIVLLPLKESHVTQWIAASGTVLATHKALQMLF